MFFRTKGTKGAFGYFCRRDKSNSHHGLSGNETDCFRKTENERKGHSLLRFPKSLAGLERRGILTAAPSSPRFIRHRRHFGDDAPAARARKTHNIILTKNKRTNKKQAPIRCLLEIFSVILCCLFLENFLFD